MGQDIPKQFMFVEDAPIIIHTIRAFQRHPDIDAIAVVCLEGWETILQSYANQFNISKLKWIFKGGGSDTNCVLAGHRGWNGAAYFLYINQLEPGDTVTVTNLWETLNYQVKETKVISESRKQEHS